IQNERYRRIRRYVDEFSGAEEFSGCCGEYVCDMHIKYLTFLRAQTILVDGALREGEPLIPLPSFEILSTERVEAVYPLLKDVALSPDIPFCIDCLFEEL
ncbi:hypothetical protein HID58_092883, partial [Brassica napus]